MNTEHSSDPLERFREWQAEGGTDTVAVATATADGAPSVRMVLLRGADERGLAFFTGYESRKGQELAENPRAALLFYWADLGRQIRVEGTVEQVDAAESDEYWATRPRGSRVAARASEQSRPLDSREALEARFAEVDAEYPGEVPRPESWGGYRLRPQRFEFWTHRDNRLHDRELYVRDGDAWTRSRLMP